MVLLPLVEPLLMVVCATHGAVVVVVEHHENALEVRTLGSDADELFEVVPVRHNVVCLQIVHHVHQLPRVQ